MKPATMRNTPWVRVSIMAIVTVALTIAVTMMKEHVAAARNFVVEDSLRLPVDVEVLGIYPHAHYLGKRMGAWAILPDQQKRWLILIPRWDIDRQSVYRYRKPVFLPKRSVMHMRYIYDNSSGNLHNPHNPPVRVKAGNRSDFRHALQLAPDHAQARANLEHLPPS